MNRQIRKAMFDQVDLYPVTCERLSAGRSDLEILEAVMRGGAKIVQLREKERSAGELYRLGLKFREITSRAGVLLILNDHVDIALAVEADGVHLGRTDLPIAAARRLAPELLIGASAHSLEEALEAEREGADYVNIGPIFPTRTKEVDSFLGPAAIRAIAPHLKLPFTVMGGINATNIGQVIAEGARRVAVVTAVTQAEDVAGAAALLREKIGKGLSGSAAQT